MMLEIFIFALVIFSHQFAGVALQGNVGGSKSNHKSICSPGYTRYNDDGDKSNGTRQICIRFINNPGSSRARQVTWVEADEYCKSHFSFLLDVGRLTYDTTALERYFATLKDVQLIWTSIHVLNGYYFWESNDPRLFQSSEEWGNKWNDNDEPIHDCVALNVSSGTLVTFDCLRKLPYLCMNNGYTTKPINTPACSEGWKFTYHLDTKRNSCFKIFKPLNFSDSAEKCRNVNGELITAVDYHGMYHVLKDHYSNVSFTSAFWVDTKYNKAGSSCNINAKITPPAKMTWKNESCDNKLNFICKRKVRNIIKEMDIWISPWELESFSSNEVKDLACHAAVNSHAIQNVEYESLSYQWFKNELPIYYGTHAVLYPVNVYDGTKEHGHRDSRQGIYQCKVAIAGFNHLFSSQQVEVIYSDFSTYVITFKGIDIDYTNTQHFSRAGFQSIVDYINGTIDPLIKEIKRQLSPSSVTYDFQRMSMEDSISTIKILLFLNWTGDINIERPKNEEKDVYSVIFRLLQNNCNIASQRGLECDIRSIDKCFSETFSSQVSVGQMWWPEASPTRNATSIPPCINDKWQLVRRTCKTNFDEGAKWESFNYSLCSIHQPEDQEWKQENKLCNVGFTPIGNSLCYKFHSTDISWRDAHKKCSKDYSYMYTVSPDDNTIHESNELWKLLVSQGEFWSGCKRQNGIFQWLGRIPQHLKLFDGLRWGEKEPKKDLDCVSLVLESSSSNAKVFFARTKNCTEKKKFLCVQNPISFSTFPTCPINFQSMINWNKCYYVRNNGVTFEEAKEKCKIMHSGSKLLTLENVTSYSIIKQLMKQLEQSNNAFSVHRGWWMGLQWSENAYHWLDSSIPDIAFVDWSQNVDFNLTHSSGLLHFEHKGQYSPTIKWGLDDPGMKYGYICESQRLERCSDASAYIKVLSNHQQSLENISQILQIPELICEKKNSVYNSTVWYKEGIPLAGYLGVSGNHTFYPLSVLKKNITLVDIIRCQGYYVCATEQFEPFQIVKSHQYLLNVVGINTFACIMISSFNLSQLQDNFSSGKYLLTGPQLEDELNYILKATSFYGILKNVILLSNTYELHFHFAVVPLASIKRQIKSNEQKYWASLMRYFNDIKTNNAQPEMLNWIKKYQVSKDNITVRSTVYCYEEKENSADGILLTWPTTAIGKNAISKELCVNGRGEPAIRHCMGDFNLGAYWGLINGECSRIPSNLTVSLWTLANISMNSDNVHSSFENLRNLTMDSDALEPVDIHYVGVTLNNIADVSSDSHGLIDLAAETVNSILEVQSDILDGMQRKLNSSSSIAASLEQIISSSKISGDMLEIHGKNLALVASDLNKTGSEIPVGITISSENELNKYFITTLHNNSVIDIKGIDAGILLPLELVKQHLEHRLSFVVYRKGTLFKYRGYQNYSFLNSPVIHVYLGSEQISNLNHPVKMYFKPTEDESYNSSPVCSYWKQSLNFNFGGWAGDGCSFKGVKDGRYVCYCDHLTNFAALLQFHQDNAIPKDHEIALEVIAYIGCGFSLFGLSIIVLTFVLFREWRKGNKHQTLFNLALALIAVLITFMIGIEKKKAKILCIFIAVSLHYFLLVSFSWMLVEAIVQYLNFVKVWSTYIPKFMQKAVFCAWGVPLLIVTVVLIVNYESYYENKKYCWLANDAFNYSFVLPVVCLLVANITVFCLVVYSINCGRDIKLQCNQDERKSRLIRFRAAVCIFFLLGLSWIFGFLAVGKASVVFQYLFSLITTLQGFFIFIFFIVRDKKTREMWLHLIFSSVAKAGKPQSAQSTGGISMSQTRHGIIK